MMTDDHNFKNLILDYSVQALQFFAPGEMAHLPADVRITPLRQEQTKERLGDRFYELDIAVQLEFPDGSREAIVFCIEEESRGDTLNWRRHAIYCLQLSELLDTTRVVPVVVYPFASHPPKDDRRLATEREVYLDFRGLVVTLGAMEARDHVDSRNLVERYCLPLMKHRADEKLEIVAKAFEGLFQLESNWDKQKKYFAFISCYADLKPEQVVELTEKHVTLRSHKENIMSLRDALLELGAAKGKAEGKAEGSVAGRADLIAMFFETGVLTLEAARSNLECLAAPGDPNRPFVDAALKRIGA